MVAVLVIVMIAVVIIAGAVVWNALRGPSGPVAAPTESSSPPATPAKEETSSQPDEDTSPSPTADEDVLQEGWQKATAPKWSLSYEVPAKEGWVVDDSGTLRGWTDDDSGESTSMSGTAGYRDGYQCRGRSAAELGVRGITDTTDTKEMAQAVATDWALASYKTDEGEPAVQPGSVESFSANDLEGHHAYVEVAVKPAQDCDPDTARVHAVAVPNPEGSESQNGVRVLLIDMHTGIDDQLDSETVDTIVSTVRDSDYEIPGSSRRY